MRRIHKQQQPLKIIQARIVLSKLTIVYNTLLLYTSYYFKLIMLTDDSDCNRRVRRDPSDAGSEGGGNGSDAQPSVGTRGVASAFRGIQCVLM